MGSESAPCSQARIKKLARPNRTPLPADSDPRTRSRVSGVRSRNRAVSFHDLMLPNACWIPLVESLGLPEFFAGLTKVPLRPLVFVRAEKLFDE
jgi:hypothetical protein